MNSAKGVDRELVPDKVFLFTNKQTNKQTTSKQTNKQTQTQTKIPSKIPGVGTLNSTKGVDIELVPDGRGKVFGVPRHHAENK